MGTPLKIATLGPAGSNHDLNTRRYIEFHGLDAAKVVFIEDFLEGIDMMRRREVDLMIQVCAHHRVADTIEVHHTEVFLIDCFIGRTHPMGLLTRAEVESPLSVGYILPTAGFFDPSRFQTQVHTLSNSDTARRLLAGTPRRQLLARRRNRFRQRKLMSPAILSSLATSQPTSEAQNASPRCQSRWRHSMTKR
jgi:hypothetical protein